MTRSADDGPIDWARLVALVTAHQRFVITSHVRPDGDALGSELGLCGILESLGKQASIINADATPPRLHFLDPTRKIQVLGADQTTRELDSADCVVVVDTGSWIQLGAMADVLRRSAAKKIVIDHHLSADDLGAEVFKDPRAEASGRLVFELSRQLAVPLTTEIAYWLLAAVATDTGWFRFSSTTDETLCCAAALVAAGARPEILYAQLYEQDSLARTRLMGRALSRTETELDGRLVYTSVRADDFDATGALRSDTEDVINMTLMVRGTEAAMILVEQPDGRCKLSLRSRGALDCSRLAEQFGGGGHRAAAGATLDGPLESARQRVLDALRTAMG